MGAIIHKTGLTKKRTNLPSCGELVPRLLREEKKGWVLETNRIQIN